MLIKDGVRVEVARKRVWIEVVADTEPRTFWLRIVHSPCALSISPLSWDDVLALAQALGDLVSMQSDAQRADK